MWKRTVRWKERGKEWELWGQHGQRSSKEKRARRMDGQGGGKHSSVRVADAGAQKMRI